MGRRTRPEQARRQGGLLVLVIAGLLPGMARFEVPRPPGLDEPAQLADLPDRNRGLLPLPGLLTSDDLVQAPKCGRASLRRVQRRGHWKAWAAEGIDTTNELAGCSSEPPSASCNAAQRVALDNISECYQSLGKPPAGMQREGSLKEILASSALYSHECSHILPYAKDKMSWPAEGAVPVAVDTLFSKADKEWFAGWRRHMLRPDHEVTQLRRGLG